MLDSLGLAWRPVQLHSKGWFRLPFKHAFEVVIEGERVWIWQRSEGQTFVFQSEGVLFRDQSTIQDMARLTVGEVRRRQEEQAAVQMSTAEEEARRRRLAAEQAAREHAEAARQRAAEKEAAETEAEAILERMSSGAERASLGGEAIELPLSPDEIEAGEQYLNENARPVIGRMLQANARELIRQQEEQVRSEFGLSLQQETQDGDVIVLTFRG
ncbi:MAG: hypothetical protein ACREL5_03160 [Gemmatimonadales bacterium]